MTLCMAWRDNKTVHFASDSRITLAMNSYTDVGIKVLSIPYRVLNPGDSTNNRTVAFRGELGMCFAGSAINSLMVKESVAEALKCLQYVPGYTDTSMDGIASFVFKAYKIISEKVCETTMGPNGRATILIGGMCSQKKMIRVFQLSTDDYNNHTLAEVLTNGAPVIIGTGATAAIADIPESPADVDYFNVLRSIIDDENIPTVGGNIQYGCFDEEKFTVHGLLGLGENPHYWRGGLDLNSDIFMNSTDFVPALPYLDPFKAFIA